MSASLMVDLQGIDLKPVEQARAAITAAISSPDLQKILSGGAFQTALGGLGTAIGALQSKTPDASALLMPIVDAAGSLLGHVDSGKLPLANYAGVVSEGAKIVLGFVGALQGDPASLAKVIPFDQMGKIAEVAANGMSIAGGDPIGEFRALLDRLEAGVPGDPQALARLAIDALLPFGGSGLVKLRESVDIILKGTASITLPRGRFGGLLAVLDAVEIAATAANPQQLAKALADFDRIRRSTLQVLTADLLAVRDAIAGLHVAETLAPAVKAAGAIRAGEDGFLEIMERFRGYIAEGRAQVEAFDGRRIPLFLDTMMQFLEDQARLRIEKPIDESVKATQEFVRGLFRHLPIRALRAEITSFLHSVASAIEGAHLDAVAKDIHAAIAEIDHALDPATLAAEVQALLGDVKPAIEGVVNGIKGALGTVVGAIQTVQADLEGVLHKVVDVLDAFSTAMKTVTDAINSLDVDGATQQVIDSIHQLRETAQKLFGAVPLPEPLKPVVEQVISTLESIDFDATFAPIEAAIAQIKVPDEVKAKITAGLQEVQAKLENAIPATLIESINAEVEHALDTIRNFDPNKLLDGVRKYLDEAAAFLESLDVAGAAEKIRGPLQAVLDALDRVEPHILLAPVISAYDSLLGKIEPPSLDGLMGKVTGAIESFGNAATQKLVTPLTQLTGGKADVAGSSGAAATGASSSAAGGAPPPAPAPLPTTPDGKPLRPGDVIRVLGWVPTQLRDGLKAISASAAGDALRAIDSLTSGLARDLRIVRHRLLDVTARVEAALDDELRAVSTKQVRAQLAIQLHASGPGFNADASVLAIATVNPGAMRKELAAALGDLHGSARGAFNAVAGETAVALDQAASALETFRLTGMLSSVDHLLAALDPEPIAAELDALAAAVIKKAPEILDDVMEAIGHAVEKIGSIVRELNPATQATKFLSVLDVLKEELDVLNPAVLADELSAVHAVIRNLVAAYDPRAIAADLTATITHVAHTLRTLDVKQILGDLDFFTPVIAAVEEANPAKVLASVGADLATVGEQLAALDPAAMLTSIETLIPNLEASFKKAIEAIVAEIVALLESLKYASGNASASASVTVNA